MSELVELKSANILLSNIGGKIIKSQNLLKMIKYDTPDCLSKADLNIQDIVKLVGKGENPNSEQRIFKQPFYDSIIEEPRTELRFFLPDINPTNVYLADTDICFQTVVYNSKWDMDNNQIKPIRMLQEILTIFNGKDSGVGIGLLHLKKSIRIINYNKYFSGYYMILNTRMV